jgi:carbonic anhydrase
MPKQNFNYIVLIACIITFQIYLINSQAPEADPDYTKQSEWKGSCNVGSRQSPINIITNDVKMCPYNRQFTYNYTNAKISVHPFGKNLKSIFSEQTFVKFLKDDIDT